MSQDSDTHLLFGILALQMDFISRDELVAATAAWVKDKSRPLAGILVEQGSLDETVRDLLQGLVTKHLELHGDAPQRSLAALDATLSVRRELVAAADGEVAETLSRAFPVPQEGTQITATWEPEATTSADLRYRVLRPHAKGGLGEVFVAHDAELNREVALKVIQSHHADRPRSRGRFTLEAKITGGLEHPGIVPVYGLGCYPDGRPFYAMRFIRGASLTEAIKDFHAHATQQSAAEQSLEFRKLLSRFIDVCQAIEYAHSRGVLHRDLKPANVMLGRYGETLVVDWGLAKVAGEEGGDAGATDEPGLADRLSAADTPETMLGEALGTPAFMSPEQAQGRLRELGPASDVYGLGSTLYMLLTGKPPFTGGSHQVLRDVGRGLFPSPRSANARVPRALQAVCLRAMALRPADRYPSAMEVAAEIERWLADEPVRAYAEPWVDKARRWMRRHRPAVVAASVVFIFLTLSLMVGNVLVSQERDRAEHHAALTRQVVEKYLIRIGDDRWSAIPGFEEVRLDMVNLATRLYRNMLAESPDDPDLTSDAAMAFRRSANLYRMMNRVEPARAMYAEAMGPTRELAERYPESERYQIRLVDLLCDKGALILRFDGPPAAEPLFREAYDRARQWRQSRPRSFGAQRAEARAQSDYADILRECGRSDEAVAPAKVSAESLSQLADAGLGNPMDPLLAAFAWAGCGAAARQAGQVQQAEAALEEAMQRARRLLEINSADPNSRYTLAWTCLETGRLLAEQEHEANETQALFDEAETLLERLRNEFPKIAKYEEMLAKTRTERGRLHLATNQLVAAAADAERSIERLETLDEESGGPVSLNRPLAHAYLLSGQVAEQQEKPTVARQRFEQARQRLVKAREVNPDDPRITQELATVEARL